MSQSDQRWQLRNPEPYCHTAGNTARPAAAAAAAAAAFNPET
jgi:hypothetical protein